MNIHILVEGVIGEAKVYKSWVPIVNPLLSFVEHISEIRSNNFSILSGGGYPNYLEVIQYAIDDLNEYKNVDRLVIAADSEQMTYQEKYEEIDNFVKNMNCHSQIRIVVQHFCLETWALANRNIIRPKPQSESLRKYIRLFNVRNYDPELLPDLPQESMNRAQFAEKYLRSALNDKYRNLTYSKGNPSALLHSKYFGRVRGRMDEKGHIPHFQNFIDAFL
jgi:hypothetical protein